MKTSLEKPACFHTFLQKTNETQNIQQAANPARQLSQHSTATATQRFSLERGSLAEGVTLKVLGISGLLS